MLTRSTIEDALAQMDLDGLDFHELAHNLALRPVATALDQVVNRTDNLVNNGRPIPTEVRCANADDIAHAVKIARTLEALAEAAHRMVERLEGQLDAHDAAILAILAATPAPSPPSDGNPVPDDPTSILSQSFPAPEPEPEAPPETPLQPEPEPSPDFPARKRKGS